MSKSSCQLRIQRSFAALDLSDRVIVSGAVVFPHTRVMVALPYRSGALRIIFGGRLWRRLQNRQSLPDVLC